jgi:hypothetical protein
MSLWARCRRWLRSLTALSKTRYWLLTRAVWLALVLLAVFVVDAGGDRLVGRVRGDDRHQVAC